MDVDMQASNKRFIIQILYNNNMHGTQTSFIFNTYPQTQSMYMYL